MLKQILDWWASSIIFLKFTKNWCVNRYTNILILLYHHNNLVFLKDTVSSIVLWLGWRNSKNEVSGGDSFGDFFTDLSKAFDNNSLIIELSWYAVRTKSLNLIFYLRNWMIHSVNNDRTNNSNNKNCEINMYGIQCLDLYYLVLAWLTFSLNMRIVLVALPMTLLPTLVQKT